MFHYAKAIIICFSCDSEASFFPSTYQGLDVGAREKQGNPKVDDGFKVPIKTLLIDGNCRVEDRGLKTQHGHRIPLDFRQGDKFREAAISYINPLLTKGVPSLFSDLSPLYDHPGKADMLDQLILELEHSIRINGRYPDRCCVNSQDK